MFVYTTPGVRRRCMWRRFFHDSLTEARPSIHPLGGEGQPPLCSGKNAGVDHRPAAVAVSHSRSSRDTTACPNSSPEPQLLGAELPLRLADNKSAR